ncbi:MAG: sulfatase [Verrucomicrobia bacterium]|nr:MAG: sulfatase [Verrucomicrobiota bacterium]
MTRQLLVIAIWSFAALTVFAAGAPPRPNIVFILADDLGPNDLACYGRREHHTPNLDRLAAEGSRFTCAYVAQPICSPSRAAILTGKTPARLHLTTYLPGRPDCPSQKLLHPIIEQQLPLAERTVAECLHDAGYATACIGKWHLGGEGFLPTDQGFDLYHPGNAVTKPSATEGGKGEYDLTARAIEFVQKNRDRPFFLYLAHNSPHIPYSARPELVAKNAGAFEPVYAALVETLDNTVGLLLAKLDALGLRDRTLVIFTSDHGGLHVPEGPHARITHNTPFRAGKGYLYEGGLRVPLIARWPGKVPADRVVDTPIINTDWLPTLVEIAGAGTPRSLDGVSIASLLLGRGQPKARRFYWHFPHYTNQGGQPAGAIREGDWKLVEHYEDGRVELFNLAKDISETTDLSARERRRVARLKNDLAAWRQRVGAQTNTPNPKFDPALHRQIYVDFVPSTFDPLRADAATWARAAAWRKQMDAVLYKPKTPAPY